VRAYNGDQVLTDPGSAIYAVLPPPPPGTPESFIGTAESTSSIKWSWNDVAGEDGYYLHDFAHAIKGTTMANMTSVLETGLPLPNTQYTRHVNAYNAYGSKESSSYSAYTLANIPTGLATTDVTSSSVTLSWSGDGTRYAVERTTQEATYPYALKLVYGGTQRYLNVPYGSDLDIATNLSAAAWIYFTGEGANNNPIIGKETDNTESWMLLRYAGGGNPWPHRLGIGMDIEGWGDRVQSNTTINNGQWYHVAATYDGSNAKIYVNGILDNSNPCNGSMATGNGPVKIGAHYWMSEWDDVIVDEAAIWDRVLSSSEISGLYNGGAGLRGNMAQLPWSDHLVAGWHFDEGAGITAEDFSGHSHNGTLVNGASWEAGIVTGGGAGSWNYIADWNSNVITTEYTDTAGLTHSTTYWYRVRAYNGDQILTDPGSAIYTKTLAPMSSYYMTKVGSNEEWSWRSVQPGEKVPSGTPLDWQWRTWKSVPDMKIPSGEAHDWMWGNE
jgi:hypothetical protein